MQTVKFSSLNVKNIKKTSLNKRAFFLSSESLKAGMALEGSLVLPLFLFFMMTVLLTIEAVRFQSQVQEGLYQAGNESAFQSYRVKYEDGSKADVQGQIREYLESQLYPYLCVQEGRAGVTVEGMEDISTGEIAYSVSYRLRPFISSLPIGLIQIKDRFVSHGWIGYQGTEAWAGEGSYGIYVYVTAAGSRYHLLRDCTYLHIPIQAAGYEQVLSLRNRSGGKYYPCQRCRPLKEGTVYITADGSCYHGDADCSALKRTVHMIPLSEASAYQPCSKCAG